MQDSKPSYICVMFNLHLIFEFIKTGPISVLDSDPIRLVFLPVREVQKGRGWRESARHLVGPASAL